MNGPAGVPPPPGREGELLPPRRLSWLDRLGLWWAHPCHRWKTVKDTGATLYEHCVVCGERRAYRYVGGGYQPIDRQWVATGAFAAFSRPTPRDPFAKPTPKPLDTVDDTQRRPPVAPDDRPPWPDLYGDESA